MVLGEPSWKNGFVSLEIAVAKARQWGTCHFVLKHRKLWAAAELIAEKVAASAWGAGNKQMCYWFFDPRPFSFAQSKADPYR